MHAFSASKVHPTTWWLLGISFAVFGSLSFNLVVLLLQCVAVVLITVACRESAPWSKSLKFYLFTAAFVVAIRIGFRLLFSYSAGADDIVLKLPLLEINLGLGAVHLLGPVSWTALNGALVDGFRLAAIILSIGLANTLANPRKLLKSTPSALYEIATAISVSINLAPQLIESLARVRRARTLRGRSKGMATLASTVIPVLEDTLDRSLMLAASMDARGFGRRGAQSAGERRVARILSLVALCLNLIGVFLVLSASSLTGAIAIIGGLTLAFVSVRIASRRKVRTSFARQRRTLADLVTYIFAGCLLLVGLLNVLTHSISWGEF